MYSLISISMLSRFSADNWWDRICYVRYHVIPVPSQSASISGMEVDGSCSLPQESPQVPQHPRARNRSGGAHCQTLSASLCSSPYTPHMAYHTSHFPFHGGISRIIQTKLDPTPDPNPTHEEIRGGTQRMVCKEWCHDGTRYRSRFAPRSLSSLCRLPSPSRR